jgi:hypothetical protein
VEHEPIALPNRVYHPDYTRQPLPKEMFVPAVY